MRTLECRHRPPVGPPFGTAVKDAHFSPDGRLVLTGSADGLARFWNVATGGLAGPPLKHDTGVITRFSPDGRHDRDRMR